MKKVPTFLNRLLAMGAVAGLLASCSSSKLTMVQTAPANQNIAVTTSAGETDEVAPAAAQGAQSAEVYASANEGMASTTTVSTLEKARQENLAMAAALKKQASEKKLSLPARMALKSVAKKLEKASHKLEVKDQKAKKDAKVTDPQIRTGIIIALVGLGLLLVGAITGLWFLYTLGGIGITVGLVVILLAALDVI